MGDTPIPMDVSGWLGAIVFGFLVGACFVGLLAMAFSMGKSEGHKERDRDND